MDFICRRTHFKINTKAAVSTFNNIFQYYDLCDIYGIRIYGRHIKAFVFMAVIFRHSYLWPSYLGIRIYGRHI